MTRIGSRKQSRKPPSHLSRVYSTDRFNNRAEQVANVDFRASVQAGHCCFCGKPVISGSEEVTRKRVTVETTAGSSCEFNYHEACFQEWLGNREHAPASVPKPDQRFIKMVVKDLRTWTERSLCGDSTVKRCHSSGRPALTRFLRGNCVCDYRTGS